MDENFALESLSSIMPNSNIKRFKRNVATKTKGRLIKLEDHEKLIEAACELIGERYIIERLWLKMLNAALILSAEKENRANNLHA